MNTLNRFFGKTGAEAKRLASAQRQKTIEALAPVFPKLKLYGDSPCAVPGGLVVAARDGETRKLIVCGDGSAFEGTPAKGAVPVKVCDTNVYNMTLLRKQIGYLRPILAGQQPSLGLGDRLGVATPGHIAAGGKSGFVLVLAQQSIREMTRTGRSAQQVMDEAVFGVFQAGYTAGFGSDGDHLKTTADVDVCAQAGFTMFTIDPSAYVDDGVEGCSTAELAAKLERMAAEGVPGAKDWTRKYLEKVFTAGKVAVRFDAPALLRAAVKYGRAVAHAETLARHIAKVAPRHELELSVDETVLPTSVAEHLFIAHELSERGVKLAGLAPRYLGAFEKGVDYKGNLSAFEAVLHDHAAIARHYGPYKLSVHSGSDKFAIYPIVARVTEGRFHVKTAGTSYLEALRVAARCEAGFFREVVAFCRARFNTDKASYHISVELEQVPPAEALKDASLERVYLDENGGRQILHVTFGSVLTANGAAGQPLFRGRLLRLLNREAALYAEFLRKHIGRHIEGLTAGL